MHTTPSPDQLRAARALLGLEQRPVAREAGISIATLRRVEAGLAPTPTVARVAEALIRAGASFIENGVQRRTDGATIVADRARQIADILARADALPVLDMTFTEASLYGDDGLPR